MDVNDIHPNVTSLSDKYRIVKTYDLYNIYNTSNWKLMTVDVFAYLAKY